MDFAIANSKEADIILGQKLQFSLGDFPTYGTNVLVNKVLLKLLTRPGSDAFDANLGTDLLDYTQGLSLNDPIAIQNLQSILTEVTTQIKRAETTYGAAINGDSLDSIELVRVYKDSLGAAVIEIMITTTSGSQITYNL